MKVCRDEWLQLFKSVKNWMQENGVKGLACETNANPHVQYFHRECPFRSHTHFINEVEACALRVHAKGGWQTVTSWDQDIHSSPRSKRSNRSILFKASLCIG